MPKLLHTRVVKSRVEKNEYGYEIAVPCDVRAYVRLDNGQIQFFSAGTRKAAIALAEQGCPGLEYDEMQS